MLLKPKLLLGLSLRGKTGIQFQKKTHPNIKTITQGKIMFLKSLFFISLFLFATHLHQLSTMKEITSLDNVVDLHLSVEYDEEKDAFLFNRVLQAGSGSSIYGL